MGASVLSVFERVLKMRGSILNMDCRTRDSRVRDGAGRVWCRQGSLSRLKYLFSNRLSLILHWRFVCWMRLLSAAGLADASEGLATFSCHAKPADISWWRRGGVFGVVRRPHHAAQKHQSLPQSQKLQTNRPKRKGAKPPPHQASGNGRCSGGSASMNTCSKSFRCWSMVSVFHSDVSTAGKNSMSISVLANRS